MNKIIVLDTETNKEFEVLQYDSTEERVVIKNECYGICSQVKQKLKFVRAED